MKKQKNFFNEYLEQKDVFSFKYENIKDVIFKNLSENKIPFFKKYRYVWFSLASMIVLFIGIFTFLNLRENEEIIDPIVEPEPEEKPQEPLASFNETEIINSFNNSTLAKSNIEYEITNVFSIYGYSIIIEINQKDKEVVSINYSTIIVDDIMLVIPKNGLYSNLLVYNNGQFMTVKDAYNNELLTKLDLLDLKIKLDNYYYHGDAWYERITYKLVLVNNNEREYLIDYYYNNNGLFSTHTDCSSLTSYSIKSEEYQTMMTLFDEKYDDHKNKYVLNEYYGDIDGIKIFNMIDSKSTGAGVASSQHDVVSSEVTKIIGKYSFISNGYSSGIYVFVDGDLFRLEEAYENHLVSDYILRFIAYFNSIKLGFVGDNKTVYYPMFVAEITD